MFYTKKPYITTTTNHSIVPPNNETVIKINDILKFPTPTNPVSSVLIREVRNDATWNEL